MGIPSYYKKLSEKVKGLISHSVPYNVQGLYFDFNCLIYYIARRPTMTPYPGDEKKLEWEDNLIDEIIRYVVYVWNQTGKAKEVFLALDGVVPMAKIKQQRLRRFKSVWLAEEEKNAGIRENVPNWDTNCITPGTGFMRRLGSKLEALCSQRPGWKVSTTLEPGEGEHKIMNLLRKKDPGPNPIFIYGLDADLILLTLLNSQQPAYLVREDLEMGGTEETFSYFSVDCLMKSLWGNDAPTYHQKINYVSAMTLLGNDFLPHSLSVKIKENGHARLLETLRTRTLVEQVAGLWSIQKAELLSILQEWAAQEENWILHSFHKKLQMKGRIPSSLETIPLDFSVEQRISTGNLKDVYRQEWMVCRTPESLDLACREYCIGLQWVIDYYTGQREIDLQWYYTRLLPPLWGDLVSYLQRNEYPVVETTKTRRPIEPIEQLAMVLPIESWSLIENPAFRALPVQLPQYWPSRFGLFTVGRTRTWECEPLLPLLPIDVLRNRVEKK
jgi:5'-3' exonuclease